MARLLPLALTLILCLASLGCRGAPPPRVLSRLYFGLSGPDGPIEEAAFQRFVDEELVPALPGFTIYQAEGAWKGEQGVEREPSRVLEVIVFAGDRDRKLLLDLAERYRERFKQQSVIYLSFPVDVVH